MAAAKNFSASPCSTILPSTVQFSAARCASGRSACCCPRGPFSAGQLQIELTTDSETEVLEVNPADDAEQNNVVTTQVNATLKAYPDLAVTSFEAPSLVIGDPGVCEISFVVTNRGPANVLDNSWHDVLIASSNSVVGDADDIELARLDYSGDLATDASYTRRETIYLPIEMQGRFQLFVYTDAEQSIFEDEREQNNQQQLNTNFDVMQAPYADLVVTEIDADPSAFSGQAVNLRWTVSNVGLGMTSKDSWYDEIYLATDPQGQNLVYVKRGNYEVPWEARFEHLGFLDAGASYTHATSVTLPDGLDGTYYLVVAAAPDYGPFEFVYDDNNQAASSAMQIQLTAPPDLTVSDLVVPEVAWEESSIDVAWTVINQGGGSAEGQWTDHLFLREDNQPDAPPIHLGTFRYEGELGPGISYTRRETVRLPRHVEGNFRLVAVTNVGETLFEHGATDNNTVLDDVPLPIQRKPRPDLQVTSIVVPEIVESGGPLSVEWDVSNLGSVATTRARWVDRVYLSLDNELTADDLLLGTLR